MKRLIMWVVLFGLVGCAGLNRNCSSCMATTYGSDWIVVQYKFDGNPINCWRLYNTSIANEEATDGIYWLDSTSGHLVHISGWYNRIQVKNEGFEKAAELLGIDISRCQNGKYR